MRTVIVGAGMAGLAAAKTMQAAGQDYLLLEKSDKPGGRVKSDSYKGFTLDHGFQVLLTAYPAAKEFFDYSELDLKRFDPGAVIQQVNQKPIILDDPARNPSRIFSMAFEKRISLMDKVRVLLLKRRVNKLESEHFFTNDQVRAYELLKDIGFTENFLNLFFEPFYAGISLRPGLQVDSAFFQFVFKMFSNGDAAIPANGIGELANQLAGGIPSEKIRYNSNVLNASGNQVSLDNGDVIECDRCILAAPSSSSLWKPYMVQETDFIKTYVFYFSADSSIVEDKKLHLFPGTQTMANNLVNVSAISPSYAPDGKSLLSVQVNAQKEGFPAELQRPAEALRLELQQYYLSAKEWEFLSAYEIKEALPFHRKSRWPTAQEQVITNNLFAAGDSFGFASLQSALHSGKLAAQLACQ